MRRNSGWCRRVWILRQRISLYPANSTDLYYLAATRRLPELMSLRLGSQKQNCRASLPQNFALNRVKHPPAVEHLLFEPAECRSAERPADLQESLHLRAPDFQVGQLD